MPLDLAALSGACGWNYISLLPAGVDRDRAIADDGAAAADEAAARDVAVCGR